MSSPALDRQIQEFQFRIQQKLKLQDEEINRLSDHLVNIKSKIIETQKNCSKINDQIEQVKEYQASLVEKRKIDYESKLSQIHVSHLQDVQQLQEFQAAQVAELQKEFQECLDKVGIQSKEKSSEENAAIENELDNVRTLLQSLQEALEEAKTQREDASSGTFDQVADVDRGVIDELRETLVIRTEDRMRNLRSSKAKLQQCINLIEDLDRKHELSVQQRRQKLSDCQKEYEETKRQLSEERNAQRADEQQRLREVTLKNKRLQRLKKRREADHTSNLRQTALEADLVRGAGGIKLNTYLPENNLSEREKLNQELANRKRDLKQKEKLLFEAREENDSLKSEIGKLKHIIRFG
ncbi:hypothetical protein TVAG_499400 [Trichomonas vaginalis G3]|uniref:Uncharacterized protein n=1 Tax=Trichomonas vaginalis (strain ATCC PRA-98 / G3) TaxID=412133 RepID=A2EIM7_TRIV3|nr:hypothetical protein TVAGG3_0960190 [Trichomonas vaginalis G3]EAY07454.1 hypothetical protein TVAG_499400 [Trichomonas vaginalis G3]KAI5487850.1 hypothetical protein TVAGG3_0960190 [Trichomonas vaginalis G3]|eukprot:XP_001319677.1 hypothetical protein [Trichomonas vaginalis G3]